MTTQNAQAAPVDAWPDRLRASGRTIAWLSQRLGVQRTYLSAVASGARSASPTLLARIEAELAPARLDDPGAYASGRVAFLELRSILAAEVQVRADLAPDAAEELADDLARLALRTLGGFLVRTADR